MHACLQIHCVEDKWLQPSSITQRIISSINYFAKETNNQRGITGVLDGTHGPVASRRKSKLNEEEIKRKELYCFKIKGSAFNTQVCADFR